MSKIKEIIFGHEHKWEPVFVPSIVTGVPVVTHYKCKCGESQITAAGRQQEEFALITPDGQRWVRDEEIGGWKLE